MDGLINELKASGLKLRTSLIAVLTFTLYVLAWVPGAAVRGGYYVRAALAVGWHDGLHGPTDKPEE